MLLVMGISGLESLNIPEPTLKILTDKVGEESKESECLEGLLETELTDTSRRTIATSVVIILGSKDERGKPQVRENPGHRCQVTLISAEGW